MKERSGGLENLVGQELKQIVSKAMQKLRTRHKAVLVMRCYDEMSYAEIAESMGCSEFSTRMLFVRAKRCLQKELSRSGFGKGSLLAALVVFGKMTAPSKAAAAQLTVPIAATKAGLLASTAAVVTTKTAIVSVATVGVLTVGTITATVQLNGRAENPAAGLATSAQMISPFGAQRTAHEKYRYFFPDGPQGPVMVRAELQGNASQQYLQNDVANFYHRDGTVQINNHRMWLNDLSVMRLPTDGIALSNFLSKVEGKTAQMQTVSAKGPNMLVTVERDEDDDQIVSPRPSVIYHANVLNEDYFKSDFSANLKIVDNRDAMHARGWTYMRVRGQVAGQTITGAARIPFVYGASQVRTPWLKLRIGNATTLIDDQAGAIVQNAAGEKVAKYPVGSFFKGLGRPWMGLHAIDTIRRDAAEERMTFETELAGNGTDVEITAVQDRMKLVYTIDLEADLVKKIEFVKDNAPAGELEFEYFQDLDGNMSEFQTPARSDLRISLKKSQGIQWLVQLAGGQFAD